MPLPFKTDPEPPKRPAERDPFLEFESERPASRLGLSSLEPLVRPEPPDLKPPPQTPPPLYAEPPRRSAISPAITFAVGVAGLVTAAVAYYQMGQFLSSRAAAPPAAVQTSPATSPVTSARTASGAASERGGNPPSRQRSAGAATDNRGRGVQNPRPVRPTPPQSSRAAAAAVATPAAGFVTFEAPIDLQIFRDGRLVGSSRGGRIQLPAGTYDVTLVNAAHEFRQTISVTTTPGLTTQTNVAMPTGLLSLNALPWADVWIDGEPFGATPLANLPIAVGSHQVRWKHPTLGERTQTVVVKARTPARAGVDFIR